MKRFERFEDRTEVMKEIKRRYNIPSCVRDERTVGSNPTLSASIKGYRVLL